MSSQLSSTLHSLNVLIRSRANTYEWRKIKNVCITPLLIGYLFFLLNSCPLSYWKPSLPPPSHYLGGSMVEHLLPGGIQGVLAVSHQALLSHVHHLPGSCVHRNRSLVAQSCLLGLLLSLQRGDKRFTADSAEVWQGHRCWFCSIQLHSCICQSKVLNYRFDFKCLRID